VSGFRDNVRDVLLQGNTCIIRDWRMSDVASLVRHANNRNIWINLRDRFPHPYLEAHGKKFLEHITAQTPPTVWAIEVNGEAAGGIGIERLTDVERVSTEIGYWLGQEYWNRGIVTEALKAVTSEVFRTLDVMRIFALPFADNPGSIRVLEKAGYVREGVLRDSTIKDGQLRDQFLYASYRRPR
jgi:RimJ/RimL family protein N-acetyltransferase